MKVKMSFFSRGSLATSKTERPLYDRRESGVGDYFRDSLLTDMESLVIHGGVHEKFFGSHRNASRRFPYEIKHEIAYVVAVLPMRRDSSWISGKLKQRT